MERNLCQKKTRGATAQFQTAVNFFKYGREMRSKTPPQLFYKNSDTILYIKDEYCSQQYLAKLIDMEIIA